MFYFEFQGFDKDISNYYFSFVGRKEVYPSKKLQKEWQKFVSYGEDDFSFTGEAKYSKHFFTQYCLKDMNI